VGDLIALPVQRDGPSAPSADDLDNSLHDALGQGPPDWAKAAEVLNGFNDADIKSHVLSMNPGAWVAMLPAVQPWNSRVRSALLDALYEQAMSLGDWGQAAVHLNGFNDTDIDKRLQALDAAGVWSIYQGALSALSGVSQQRIFDGLLRLKHETVAPSAGTDAIRQAVTMQARNVPPDAARAVIFGQLGLPTSAPPGAAPAQAVDHDQLIQIVGAGMVGAAAAGPEPPMLGSGKLAHSIIGAAYVSMNPDSLADPTIITIVRWAAKALNLSKAALDTLYNRLPEEILEDIKARPDIIDFGKLQIYEIKSLESAARAAPEAEGYIELLAGINIPGFGQFIPGGPTTPGTSGMVPWPGSFAGMGNFLIWCCPWPGAIVYDVGSSKDSPERLRERVTGESPVGVETMLALGLVLAAMVPEIGAATATAAAGALATAGAEYATLIPLLVEGARKIGQAIPQLQGAGG
jgi:hypothetical protein